MPVALDGAATPLPELIRAVDALGGRYGFGRVDMIENRRVGIKSPRAVRGAGRARDHRGAPGARGPHARARGRALQAGDRAAVGRPRLRRAVVQPAPRGARRVRRRDAGARDRRRAARSSRPARAPSSAGAPSTSLYDLSLATYGSEDAFDQSHAEGFVRLCGPAAQGLVREAEAGAVTRRRAPDDARSGAGGSRRRRRRRPQALGRSLAFDVRLAPQDVEPRSRTCARSGTPACSPATRPPRSRTPSREVGAEIAAGTFAFHPADEDVHSAIERGVTERARRPRARGSTPAARRNDLVDHRPPAVDARRRIGAIDGRRRAPASARSSRRRASTPRPSCPARRTAVSRSR